MSGMSDNFPPGCTGNEPEIAGYDEIEITVECPMSDCDFEGDVEAYGHGGIFYWDCPNCDAQNEYTVEDDRDFEELSRDLEEDVYLHDYDYEYKFDEVW